MPGRMTIKISHPVSMATTKPVITLPSKIKSRRRPLGRLAAW